MGLTDKHASQRLPGPSAEMGTKAEPLSSCVYSKVTMHLCDIRRGHWQRRHSSKLGHVGERIGQGVGGLPSLQTLLAYDGPGWQQKENTGGKRPGPSELSEVAGLVDFKGSLSGCRP